MSDRQPYHRPMSRWWLKNPFYVRYMVRESTAVFVGVYALVLLAGLNALASGQGAWNAWLAGLAGPLTVVFHLLALVAAVYHAVTWFGVSPKVMPLHVGNTPVAARVVTGTQYVLAVVIYVLLFGTLGDLA